MSDQDKRNVRWLRSRPTAAGFSPDKIDADAGIIYDVVMVQEGEAKGHGVKLEPSFIRDLVAYDKSSFGDRGVKARFGHPGASDNTMGMQMGFFKNIRLRNANGLDQAIGDLHLLESAEVSPEKPGMRAWVLKMAEEAPDFMMSSIVFSAGGYYQKKGNKHKVYIADPVFANPDLGDVFVEFGDKGAHFYTDLVDDGAATDNLFQSEMNPHLFVVQALEFLDEHPQLQAFITEHPEKMQAFLHRLGIDIQSNMTDVKYPVTLSAETLASYREDISAELAEAFEAERAELKSGNDSLQSGLAEVERQNTALQTRITQLEADATTLQADLDAANAEIVALKKAPAAEHTDGPTDTDPVKTEKSKTPFWDKFKAKHKI